MLFDLVRNPGRGPVTVYATSKESSAMAGSPERIVFRQTCLDPKLDPAPCGWAAGRPVQR